MLLTGQDGGHFHVLGKRTELGPGGGGNGDEIAAIGGSFGNE